MEPPIEPQKRKYNPSFEPAKFDLSLVDKSRSVDRILKSTLDRFANETEEVLEFTNMVPEEEKWNELKVLKHEFTILEETIDKVLNNKVFAEKSPSPEAVIHLVETLFNYVNILEVELHSDESIKAFGREVVYLLNALLKSIKKEIEEFVYSVKNNPDGIHDALKKFKDFKTQFFKKIYKGLITHDQTSDPVQIQIFDNLTKAIKIPPYPLAALVSLYEDFKQRKPKEDYSQILQDALQSFISPKRAELEAQIAKEKQRALEFKRKYELKVNPEFKELLSRYADYWASMTPEKLYKYIIKRRAVENLSEGRIRLEQFEDFYKVWRLMLTTKPLE